MAAKILIIYAREDEAFKAELFGELVGLRPQGVEELWEPRLLEVSGEWRAQLLDSLELSLAVCLLASSVCLQSDFFKSHEWSRFLGRQQRDDVLLVVLKLRLCDLPVAESATVKILPSGGDVVSEEFYKGENIKSCAKILIEWLQEKINNLAVIKQKIIPLQRVGLVNFRCYQKVEIELDPYLNVFVGNNGAGKSAILDAMAIGLDCVVAFLLDSPQRVIEKQDILLVNDEQLAPFVRIELTTASGWFWSCYKKSGPESITTADNYGVSQLSDLHEVLKKGVLANNRGEVYDIPVCVYYGIRREQYVNDWERPLDLSSRYEALRGACGGLTDYKRALQWFNWQEGQELRLQRKQENFAVRLPVLEAVRRAMSRMIPQVSNLRTENHPEELLVDWQVGESRQTRSFAQLSDGYRSMLALVMDLARRMAQANPHLSESLDGHAVVLIDEIDLHLHPKWQQNVLLDLRRTFPNAQFIVTTHSPQVLTTVEPHQIQSIEWQAGEVEFLHPVSSYGAESGRLLQDIQGINPRPPTVKSAKMFDEYWALIEQGKGRSEAALALRKRLEEWGQGEEPALVRADMEIKRQEFLRR